MYLAADSTLKDFGLVILGGAVSAVTGMIAANRQIAGDRAARREARTELLADREGDRAQRRREQEIDRRQTLLTDLEDSAEAYRGLIVRQRNGDRLDARETAELVNLGLRVYTIAVRLRDSALSACVVEYLESLRDPLAWEAPPGELDRMTQGVTGLYNRVAELRAVDEP
jgi:hypothetical protein